MNKTLKTIVSLLLILLTVCVLTACGKKNAAPAQEQAAAAEKSGLWANAAYDRDTSFGSGKTTLLVEVKAEDRSVTFTLKTDKETVGAALLEHGLIAGDEGEFGLYVKAVNGITADYDVDQSYWGFFKNGEMMMTGVDGEKIEDGGHYELVYTK